MHLQNNTLKVFLLLIISISIFSKINGQICINYPDIEGAPCKNCAPPGWNPTNIFQTYIHIIPPIDGPLPETNCNLLSEISGPSPSGGNVVFIPGDDNWEDENTIETTISGLNPGTTYAFGMYWEEMSAACAIHNSDGGSLKIIIDGQGFEFYDAPEWELAEVCFTPTTSFVDVVISTVLVPGEYSSIIVDGNPSCSEFSFTCCVLTLNIEEDNYSLCPGETIVLDADYINQIGSVQVEWTCNPPEGLNYLNATDVISPEFTFPATSSDYYGETYKFTLIVEDDNCTQTLECIEVEVLPSVAPAFDFELCDLDLVAVLPTESDNGYIGSWDGDFYIEFAGGTSLPFTYTLNGWQNNCIASYDYEFFVKAGYTPTFDVEEVYCLSDTTVYILPDQSEELNLGQWFPTNIFNPSDLGEGSYTFWFEPYPFEEDNFCVTSYELNIEVLSEFPLSFDLPEQFCSDTSFFVLPQVSLEGVSGTWTIDSIDLSIPIQDDVLEFTPEGSNNCSLEFNYEYSVNQNITPLFNLPDTLCAGDTTYVLPDIDTIAGSWNLTVIDLLNNIDSTIIVEYFVEEDQCYNDFSDSIFVTGLDVPQFSITESYCSNEADISLPETSDNSIQGTWNINPVDPSLQDSLVIIFTPNSGECSDVFTQTLYFTDLIDPLFTIPLSICKDEVPFTFPDLSENGIIGSWTEDTLNPSMINQSTFSNTFTPDDPTCNASFSVTIEILSFENVSLEVTDPTGCETEDGSIQIVGASTEIQLSTDNGMSWSAVTDLENLPSGSYSVQLRYEALPSCIVSYSPQLNNSEAPIIQELIPTDISSCDEQDGSIECIAEGNDLQYSIDDVLWQTSNIFENLAQGNYVIYVRMASEIDCVSSASTEIDVPDTTEICDGIDNNCNGEVDENLPTESYYADYDMDGFGDLNDLIIDCIQPQGYILDNTDCDDNNADIFPGTFDIPNNGIDEDCDGNDSTTAIHELAGQKIDIYPNPTNGLVIIEMKESIHITLSLYDINGKCLIQEGQVNNIDLSQYANGIYLIKITNHNSFESIVERIVLNK